MNKKKSPAGRKKEPNTGRASVTLPATTWARVKAQAESNRRTIRATIEILVEGALDVAEGVSR